MSAAPAMPASSVPVRIPVTIVTGFLGAGKTSLLRHLAAHGQGRRLAFLINEFGELGIDRELLLGCGIEGCGEAQIVELTNGCICCTVADDFLPAMRALLERQPPPEHIIVETSGLALPKPLLKALAWPEVRTRVTVDGVLVVADARAVLEGRFASPARAAGIASPAADHESPLEELFEEQAACADLVLVNKLDLVQLAERPAVERLVRAATRPGIGLVWTRDGAIDPRLALGLGMAAEDDLASRRSQHETEGSDHEHDDFASFRLPLPVLDQPAPLIDALTEAARRFGLLRAKGFVALRDRPMRLVVQGVGDRFSHWFDRPWRSGEVPVGGLVLIGLKDWDREAIETRLARIIEGRCPSSSPPRP